MAQGKFAVIGLGQFGSAIAKKLSQMNSEVLAIDSDEYTVESIKDDVSYAVTLDATDAKALKSQNIQEMDAVVVAIGENFQDLLLTTFALQELEVQRIVARAQGPTQRKILEKMGIEEILSPEDEVGNNVAESLVNPHVLMSMQLPDDHQIIEIKAPKSTVERTLADIALRQKYQINLVTLMRPDKDGKPKIIGVPTADTTLQKDDTIVLFGTTEHLKRFIEINK